MSDKFSIFIFTWNAGGIRLCETMSQHQAGMERNKFFNLKKECISPNFYEGIRGKILKNNPSVVVLSTQKEAEKGTYFHSDFLPNAMGEINYGLLKREKIVGEGSSLRMSIYVRYDIFDIIKAETSPADKFFGDNGQVNVSCKIGNRYSKAIAAYVWHPTYGKFAFISAYLPGNIELLNLGNTIKDFDEKTKEAAMLSANQLCLISILHKLNIDLTQTYTPDRVFLIGDLNYDIVVPGWNDTELIDYIKENQTAKTLRWLQQYDQLTKVIKHVPELGIPLVDYQEGVHNQGPLYAPTFNMKVGRPDSCDNPINNKSLDVECYNTKSGDNSGHSLAWSDRILYKENLTTPYIATCKVYNRMDMLNTHASDHAPVYGLFEINRANDELEETKL
jgi:hypothetical protein